MLNTKKISVSSLANVALSQNAELRAAVASSDLFARLKKGLRRVSVDGEEFWVAEGDTLLDEDQLGIYAFAREQDDKARAAAVAAGTAGLGLANLNEMMSAKLVGITQGGKTVRWAPDVVLTYRLARDSFTSQPRYDLVRDCMLKATKEWEDTCGVKFQHRSDLDAEAGVASSGALFVVREFDAGGQFIAAAFFPNDPKNRRRVLVDPSYFDPNLGYDKVGVLRHELGHVIGFRHEHIRSGAPAVCQGEPLDDTVDLTQYDPQSVMHYFCGGRGSKDLRITMLDRDGSRKVYGPPLKATEYLQP